MTMKTKPRARTSKGGADMGATPPATKARILWIDFCRVFIAFCVIVRHCDRHYPYPAYMADLFNYRSLIYFFFLMAGYFTHRAAAGQWVDWTRTKRLLLPYLFWTLIAIPLLQPLQHLPELLAGDWGWLTPRLLLSETGLASWCYWEYSNVPLWYLRTLLIFSFVSPLLQRLPGKVLLTLVLITFAASDVLCQVDAETAQSHHTHGVDWLPFRLYESVLALGFYTGGLLLRRRVSAAQLTGYVTAHAWLAPVGSLCLLPVVLLTGFYPPVQSSALVLLGVATTLSIGAMSGKYLPRFTRVVAQWGPAAFFVYVTHYILLHWLRVVLTGEYDGALTLVQAHVAPWGILAVSLALYAVLCRLAPRFMQTFALVPRPTAGTTTPR